MYYVMKFLTILAVSIGLLTASQAMNQPSFHTKVHPPVSQPANSSRVNIGGIRKSLPRGLS
jgi:hypothetical protein